MKATKDEMIIFTGESKTSIQEIISSSGVFVLKKRILKAKKPVIELLNLLIYKKNGKSECNHGSSPTFTMPFSTEDLIARLDRQHHEDFEAHVQEVERQRLEIERLRAELEAKK